MKSLNKLFLIITVLISVGSLSAQNEHFYIHVIDYSNSYEYDTHYVFDNEELQVYRESKFNPGYKDQILIHRQLLGKEKKKITLYLSIFTMLPIKDKYTDISNKYTGARNQKRFMVEYENKEFTTLVSNTYQEDFANFVIFLNRYIRNPEIRMPKFVAPQSQQRF